MTIKKDQYLNICKPNEACLMCGCSLVETLKHPSMIKSEESDIIRKDFCPECWKKIANRDYFSWWIARRILPDRKKKISRKERDDLLLRFFEYIHDLPKPWDARQEYLLYFLAHLLMRYKVLIWKGTRTSESGPEESDAASGETHKPFLTFENRRTGQEIQIPDQELDGDKVSEVKKEIDEFLANNISTSEEDIS